MPSITIDNIDAVTLEKIRTLAEERNRSVQSEIEDILRQSLSKSDRAKSLRTLADELANMTADKLVGSDSVELLREDRRR